MNTFAHTLAANTDIHHQFHGAKALQLLMDSQAFKELADEHVSCMYNKVNNASSLNEIKYNEVQALVTKSWITNHLQIKGSFANHKNLNSEIKTRVFAASVRKGIELLLNNGTLNEENIANIEHTGNALIGELFGGVLANTRHRPLAFELATFHFIVRVAIDFMGIHPTANGDLLRRIGVMLDANPKFFLASGGHPSVALLYRMRLFVMITGIPRSKRTRKVKEVAAPAPVPAPTPLLLVVKREEEVKKDDDVIDVGDSSDDESEATAIIVVDDDSSDEDEEPPQKMSKCFSTTFFSTLCDDYHF